MKTWILPKSTSERWLSSRLIHTNKDNIFLLKIVILTSMRFLKTEKIEQNWKENNNDFILKVVVLDAYMWKLPINSIYFR